MSTRLKDVTATNAINQQAPATQETHLVRKKELDAALVDKQSKGVVEIRADDGAMVRLKAKPGLGGGYVLYVESD